eukprot:CAMPEP_0182879450 /NCGR_PEP_ID=MMETSP0034_2-20130328/15987_1 /TAXON_ID=156128 /ORGANISM="Nephroselmis pyriformis, Strain CCMP717" /LENGTH=292 /DNA_ID=CAMNT_0025012393 /DNA_START=45 /DNA_END=920 /DNA_ORIENTATION=+
MTTTEPQVMVAVPGIGGQPGAESKADSLVQVVEDRVEPGEATSSSGHSSQLNLDTSEFSGDESGSEQEESDEEEEDGCVYGYPGYPAPLPQMPTESYPEQYSQMMQMYRQQPPQQPPHVYSAYMQPGEPTPLREDGTPYTPAAEAPTMYYSMPAGYAYAAPPQPPQPQQVYWHYVPQSQPPPWFQQGEVAASPPLPPGAMPMPPQHPQPPPPQQQLEQRHAPEPSLEATHGNGNGNGNAAAPAAPPAAAAPSSSSSSTSSSTSSLSWAQAAGGSRGSPAPPAPAPTAPAPPL